MGKLLLRGGLLQALHGILKRLVEPPVLIFFHLHGNSSLFIVYSAIIEEFAALVKKSRKSRYSVSQCFQHTCHVIDLHGKLCL